MSNIYTIDFSDPTKGSFLIPKAGFNGPGGSAANTTLRLYGRGALDWGEATDENLVRLTEHFSGATPPINPLDGQMWRRVTLYWHDSNQTTYAGWYRFDWDPNSVTYNEWVLIGGTGIVASSSSSPGIGNYYYDSGTSTLYRYDSLYKQQPAAWIERAHTARAGAPANGVNYPEVVFRVYSSALDLWKILNPTHVSPTQPAASASEKGSFWFNSTNSVLSVYDGSTWNALQTSSGGSNLDAGGNAILNVFCGAYPQPDSNNAANITYVNQAIATAVGGSPLLTALGGAGTGILVKTGSTTVVARSVANGTGITITNGSGVAGNPTVAVDTTVIAERSWVTSQIAAATTGGVVTVEPVSAGVPSNGTGSNGDIRYQY